MALKINFDVNHNPIPPTMVLTNKNGNKLGVLTNAYSIVVNDYMTETPTLSFNVSKKDNEEIMPIWDSIIDLKLVWCVEWDFWFEINVELDDNDDTIKKIDCTALCQAELSQINLYNIQINTEDDIARDEYVEPTILYNPDTPEASLTSRIMEKAPHYTVQHVDATIANIQRTFEFDGISLKDAYDEIAEEIGFYVCYDNGSIDDPEGKLGKIPARGIYLYDLESYCYDCGYRGEYTDVCPECGSSDISEGYGEDTTIYISKDNLTDDITFTTDIDSVKNCFRLVGGDDLMTATIRNCNPNGTGYIWCITDETKDDMPDELVTKLEEYDALYEYYQNDYVCDISSSLISSYNSLVTKYQEYDSEIESIPTTIVGYPALMNVLYNIIDFDLYLNDELMPTYELSETSASEQAALLTADNLSPVAVSNYSSISATTADSNVLAVAKVLVRSTYQVKVNDSSFNTETYVWTGNFKVTNYSDEDDTATSATVSVTITDSYEQYVRQKLNKALKDESEDSYDSVTLFALTVTASSDGTFSGAFTTELKKYGLVSLNTFLSCCQGCLDILIEQGVADLETWGNSTPNLYEEFYLDYLHRLQAIEYEISVRESEIAVIESLEDAVETERSEIQDALDFEGYLGETLWKTFCAYRREDEYSNDNYISDGLSNSELFLRAQEFLEEAEKEIYKSANLQHSISASLKNLLVIEEFEKLLDYFEVGNWLRIEVDGSLYKLRLIGYEIDFDDLSMMNVEFSDVYKIADGRSDIEDILSKAEAMGTSYSSVERQSSKGADAASTISLWFEDGLNATNTMIKNADNQNITWDSHGMLFRKYDDVTETYLDQQLKIINSTIAITDDGWTTTKVAIGYFYFKNPATGAMETAYGVNGETVVGKILIGENLAIYNNAGTLTFDEDGLVVTNGINTVIINPNSENLVEVQNESGDILWVDENGTLHIVGDGSAIDISANQSITNLDNATAQMLLEAKSYADNAISNYDVTVQATYETQTAAAEILSEAKSYTNGAISTLEESVASTYSTQEATADILTQAKAYSDSAITSYDLTVQATYETQTAAANVLAEAKSYADSAISNYDVTVQATYETQESAATILTSAESYTDEAISLLEESITAKYGDGDSYAEVLAQAMAYADETISNYDVMVQATYETQTAANEILSQANAYADGAISTLEETIAATYETQEAAASILTSAESYADEAISTYNATVQATYETQTAAAQIYSDAIAYTDSAISSFSTRVSSTYETKTAAAEIYADATSYADDAIANLSLTVTGSLGGTASITLSSGGSDTGTIDLSDVREAFAEDTSSIAISAGTITFNSNTFIVNSSYFSVTRYGVITATSGKVGGWTIGSNSIYRSGADSDGNTRICYLSGSGSSSDNFLAVTDTSGSAYFVVYQDGTMYCQECLAQFQINVAGDVRMWTDDEGGNIAVRAPSDYEMEYQIDAYNGSLRVFGNSDDGTVNPSGSKFVAFNTVQLTLNGCLPVSDKGAVLGYSDYRWSAVYSATSTIQTSDENEKTDIVDISEQYEQLFMKLRGVNFMWKTYDPTDTHVHDRIHCGLIAQEVETACAEVGLSSLTFATLCKDTLDEATYDGRTERYGLAYSELHGLEIHMIQKNVYAIESLDTRLETAENKIISLEEKLAEANETINDLREQLELSA